MNKLEIFSAIIGMVIFCVIGLNSEAVDMFGNPDFNKDGYEPILSVTVIIDEYSILEDQLADMASHICPTLVSEMDFGSSIALLELSSKEARRPTLKVPLQGPHLCPNGSVWHLVDPYVQIGGVSDKDTFLMVKVFDPVSKKPVFKLMASSCSSTTTTTTTTTTSASVPCTYKDIGFSSINSFNKPLLMVDNGQKDFKPFLIKVEQF